MDEATGKAEPLTIDVVSDVVCPWCFIGKRRLENALAMRPDISVVVNWRPFQLDGTIPKEGIPRQAYLERKFGSAERIREIYARVTQAGALEGIPFAFEKIVRSPNTLAAHRLIRWAHAFDKQGVIKEALFQAYFIEGRDIGSVETLIDIGAAAGLEEAMLVEFYDTEADVESVQEEIAMAAKLGIQGVPFFIFGGTHAVSGAEAPETIVHGMEQALAGQTTGAA